MACCGAHCAVKKGRLFWKENTPIPGEQRIANSVESKVISRGVLPCGPNGARKSCHHRINPQPPVAMKTLCQIPAKLLVELVLYAHVAVVIQILTH